MKFQKAKVRFESKEAEKPRQKIVEHSRASLEDCSVKVCDYISSEGRVFCTPPCDICSRVFVKVRITQEDSTPDSLEKILRKYESHFSLSINREGYARLQIHQNPALTFKGESVAHVLQLALA